jgi:hypothetical protein
VELSGSVRWRQVIGWWAVAIGLAVLYPFVGVRGVGKPADPRSARERMLRLEQATLAELTIEQSGRRIVARREGEGWVVDEPTQAAVPSDLVGAFVAAVLEAEVIDRIEDAGDLEAFGLGAGATRVELRPSGGAPETVWLGGGNPADTAVYARHLGRGGVLLVGRTLRYYAELLLEALPKARVPSNTAPRKVGMPRPLTIRGRPV